MSPQVEIPQKELTAFCRRWRIIELAFFGSVLRDDFHSDSDVDVLVSFEPEAGHSLFDVLRMEKELGRILGRDVDLIERRAVEKSRNYIRRGAILNSAEVIYAA